MKRIIRLFSLAIFVISILTLSTVKAHAGEHGPGDKNPHFKSDRGHYDKDGGDQGFKREVDRDLKKIRDLGHKQEGDFKKLKGIDNDSKGGNNKSDGDHDQWKDGDHDFGGNVNHESSGAGTPASGGNGNSVPLDGGISLLLAAGIGLGLKKMTVRNKE